MKEFILFLYNDAPNQDVANDGDGWDRYLASLRSSGKFDGGSSIGGGFYVRKGHADMPSDSNLTGFIRLRAEGLESARSFLAGNPVYEAGGTIEIRELLVDE